MNICMISHERFRLTEQALRSLYAHTELPFSLTLVDDASGEAMAQALEALAVANGFAYQHTSKALGGFAARDLSVYLSQEFYGRDRYLYVTDNDVYFLDEWDDGLAANWPIAEALGFKLLGAYCHPYNRAIETYPSFNSDAIDEVEALGGLSWLMPWRVWDKYWTPGVGDWEFCQRIRRAGGKVGALKPYRVVNTGRTGADGKPCPGAELMPDVAGVIIE